LGKLESTIKAEIQRLAKREIRATFIPLRREVRAMRLRLSGLSKSFSALHRLAKEQLREVEKKEVKLEASPEAIKASRLTPERIRNLRKKKGLSQKQLAILTGVTLGTVASWEKGKFKPSGETKASLVGLRKVKKREVRKLLAEKVEAAENPGRKPAMKGRGRKRLTKAEKTAARRRESAFTRLRKAA
jgi:DNA-binding transcriptional regulator YiaG